MLRCIITTLVCWIAIGLWLSWDSFMILFSQEKDTFYVLEVYLSFVYTLVPFIPAAVIAILMANQPWWIRGITIGLVCSAIALIFLASTQQIAIVPLIVSAIAGFLIGVSAVRSKKKL